ncbi:MAG: 1-acyl-sn-glycerol-3-phosphate acyltransferase [Clostridia bacterium]|nr:1-acyl-sn-glycerol-3-phosphate acyltransferase [Clostridia bacterium]
MQDNNSEVQETKPKKEKKQPSIFFKVNKKGQHISGCMNFLRICILPFVRLVYPFRFYGNKKVADGACLYVSNHYRMIDPMYPIATTWEGIHFIAKEESYDLPILGAFCKGVKIIPVKRDGSAADIRAMMNALKALKRGEKVGIYPEGTRNKTNEPFLPFQSGAAMLAIRAQVPIVPIVMYEKCRPFKTTHILIGDPFEFSEYYGQKMTDELLAEADEKLRNRMIEMREAHTKMLAEKKKGK